MRADIVRMIAEAGSGHPGGSLSCADILAALYFGGVLEHDPRNPQWAGARPLHPGEGPRGAGALRRARPGGLLPARGAGHAAQAGQPAAGPSGLATRCPAWRCPRARSGRGSPSRRAGRGRPEAGRRRPSRCSRCWATASARRARCGRPPCSRRTAVWTTSWPSSTATACRSTAAPSEVCDPGDLGAKFAAFGWDVAHGRRPRPGRPRGTCSGAAKAGRDGRPARRHRPHRQGQGRVVHGRPGGLARQGPERRTGRRGRSPSSVGGCEEGVAAVVNAVRRRACRRRRSRSKKATRAAYGATLAELASEPACPSWPWMPTSRAPRPRRSSADAGFADRLFNCGIAEQNMVDVAAGPGAHGARRLHRVLRRVRHGPRLRPDPQHRVLQRTWT